MKTIILAAGQGKRLLPLTQERPKALLEIGAHRLIAWQIRELLKCGIDDIVVVSGFKKNLVEEALHSLQGELRIPQIKVIYNPYYSVSDNLVSCWMARHEMVGDFILLNGDTLFEQSIPRKLMESPAAPITLAVDHKTHYDDDDMKVRLDKGWLIEIGKDLPLDNVHGESIGMSLFRENGPTRFADALDLAMRDKDALGQWYLSVIGDLAGDNFVRTHSIQGFEWCEVDYPLDLHRARRMVTKWRNAGLDPDVSTAAI